MTIKSEIDLARGYVIRHVSGKLTLDEVLAGWDMLVEDRDGRPDLDVIWNFHPGAEVAVPAEGVQQIVRRLSTYVQARGGYRLALVSPDDLNFGTGRMLEGLAAALPLDVHVFRTLDDALAWMCDDE